MTDTPPPGPTRESKMERNKAQQREYQQKYLADEPPEKKKLRLEKMKVNQQLRMENLKKDPVAYSQFKENDRIRKAKAAAKKKDSTTTASAASPTTQMNNSNFAVAINFDAEKEPEFKEEETPPDIQVSFYP